MNNFSIDRSHALREGYEQAGLFDAESVASMHLAEIFNCLRKAGYSRSDFVTGLVAERVLDAALRLQGEGLTALTLAVHSKNRDQISELLTPIRGVGPTVLQNFEDLNGVV